MDGGAWWAAVHGVAMSRARLSVFTLLFTFLHWRRKWQSTPVFLPGESQGGGAWWAAVYGVAQSRTRLKRLSSSSSKAKDHPQNGLITFNLLRAWTEQKDKGKLDLLCPFLLEPRCPPPPALSAPSSQAFRPGLKFTPLALWLSRLLIVWLTPVGLQHVVDRLGDFSTFKIVWTISYNQAIYITLYILLILFLWRTLTD